jgi:hypothetical protein
VAAYVGGCRLSPLWRAAVGDGDVAALLGEHPCHIGTDAARSSDHGDNATVQPEVYVDHPLI